MRCEWISEGHEVIVEANFCRGTQSTGREFNGNWPSRSPKDAVILFTTDSYHYRLIDFATLPPQQSAAGGRYARLFACS